jgi:hypothetical protein
VFPCWWKILPADDSVKHFRVKRYGSLGEMTQRLVRDRIRAWSRAEREPLNPLDFRRAG